MPKELNTARTRFQHTYEGLKLSSSPFCPPVTESFQHTYEGLKLVELVRLHRLYRKRFQHTYEGLKHEYGECACLVDDRFQHTYEGLKQPYHIPRLHAQTLFSAYL